MRPDSVCQGLLALDVDRERRVRAALLVDARPLRRGDHAARLHLRVLERDPRLLGALGEVGQRHAAALLQRAEAGDREPAVGHARQREDRLGRPARRAPATAGRRRRRRARARCAAASCATSRSGIHGRALDGRAELLGERAERRPLLARPRRSRARRRSASASSGPGTGSHSPARQSRTSPRGWAISPGRVVQDRRRRRRRGARRGARRRARENARGDRAERVPVACAPPTAAGPPG